MTEHSVVLGGSTAQRSVSCPGWVKLSEDIPKGPASAAAAQGTFLHQIIQEVLEDEDQREPEGWVGTTALIDGFELVFDAEMCAERLRPNLAAFDRYAADTDMEFHCEVRGTFPYVEHSFGTCDIVGQHAEPDGDVVRTVRDFLDWKFGYINVSPVGNLQLAFYAICAIGPDLVHADPNDIIRLGIIQDGELRTWDTDPQWLYKMAKVMERAVITGQEPDPPLQMGSHCKFCPAKPICPEQTGIAEQALMKDLEHIDADSIAFWLEHAKELVDFTESVRSLAHTMLSKDVEVPGWKLVPKRPARVWLDEPGTEEFVRKVVHRKSNDLKVSECFAPPKLKSPAQMDKIFKQKKVDSGLLKEYSSSVSSGLTVVADSDKRKAVDGTANSLVTLAHQIA